MQKKRLMIVEKKEIKYYKLDVMVPRGDVSIFIGMRLEDKR